MVIDIKTGYKLEVGGKPLPTISHMALNEDLREYLEKHNLKQSKYYFIDDGLSFHLYLDDDVRVSVKLNSL